MIGNAARTILKSEDIERWIESKRNGGHHVFRFRFLCPHCKSPWYQDITEDPQVFASNPFPDCRNLGKAMLCGRCDAMSRMTIGFPGEGEEQRFAISKEQIFESLGKLYKDHSVTWIQVEGLGPYSGDPKSLRDEKANAAKEINFVKASDSLYHRRAGVSISTAENLGWAKFDEGTTKQPSSRRRMI